MEQDKLLATPDACGDLIARAAVWHVGVWRLTDPQVPQKPVFAALGLGLGA